ncbi:MAG: phytanoyl-CoA dioxygenase family protein [Pseudomonadota bacterium]|nr:phytanoyl-CoA dioxygenase family protein [Pseudomonadota bacterium]
MLSASQVEQYREQGYVVPDFRLSDETVNAIRAQHERLLSDHPEFSDYCPALLIHDTGFLNYARNDEILDMVEQLIGPNIALWNQSFFAKPARVGSRTPWHQDGEYWPMRPLATCSVWIAIDDATSENGCLRFLPGTHRSRDLAQHHFNKADGLSLPLEIDESVVDESLAVDITLQAGQMSLHDVFLVHGSEPNQSPNPRRGMTLRFMPTTSIYRRDLGAGGSASAKDLRTLYLMRGSDISGQNDFRVRW